MDGREMLEQALREAKALNEKVEQIAKGIEELSAMLLEIKARKARLDLILMQLEAGRWSKR